MIGMLEIMAYSAFLFLCCRFDRVAPEVLEKLSDKEKKRQEVIFELIQTEKDYVRDLDVIVNVNPFPSLNKKANAENKSPMPQVFLIPLRKKKIINAKDLTVLFSNVEQLVPVNMVISLF